MKFSSYFTAGVLLFPALISAAPTIDGGIQNREKAAAPATPAVWSASGKKRSPVEEAAPAPSAVWSAEKRNVVEEAAEPPTAYVWTAPNKEKRNAAEEADVPVPAAGWTGSNK
ncbi:hypothetical protein V499_04570 [Pseudogymnoascus sp. VKM F-103]|uniref:Mating factor alpha n=1 Tax=Pseudogymnoascus verrucosus TaxID=342668 RepID=A0A1B8GVD8_9PEZI|nr:uncharacterized protein VE01_02087 [Pseudogymnoascus verrucosus]KFY75445.1 hypothetical protein V499_04570 [Pseudogymnoascus sp. VKM F-103]OBT99778.1 hypothetical protein VE01_02087 [Pseudogymnoascus verrucosus]